MIDVGFTPLENSDRLPLVLNLVHSQPVPWNFVILSVKNALKGLCGTENLQLVTFPAWCKELQALGSCDAASFKQNVVSVHFTWAFLN
jgi:hypothetical protein